MPFGFQPETEPGETVRVEHASDATEVSSPEELRARTARLVRANGGERAEITPAAAIAALARGLPQDQLLAVLAEMARDPRYADVEAVIAEGGAVYLYSRLHLTSAQAVEKAFDEECRLAIAARVRADSEARQAPTPARALEPLVPVADRARLLGVLRLMEEDARFTDLRFATSPAGELHLFSTRHLPEEDGSLLVAARGGDPGAAVARLVREASRVYPRPTRCSPAWARAFGVGEEALEAAVDELLQRPGSADLRRMVHPVTGVAYLFSSAFLDPERAFQLMDWEEVGRTVNP